MIQGGLAPDLCFLDINMPRTNGLQLLGQRWQVEPNVAWLTRYDGCRRARESPRTPPPPPPQREEAFPQLWDRAPDVLWDHIGIEFLGKVFSGNPKYSNPVGALPSLHAAYPVLFLLLFWAVAGTRWRFVLVGYVAAMAFVLVYFAEHYVFDVLMGWAYALAAFVLVGRILTARSAPAELRIDAVPEEVHET